MNEKSLESGSPISDAFVSPSQKTKEHTSENERREAPIEWVSQTELLARFAGKLSVTSLYALRQKESKRITYYRSKGESTDESFGLFSQRENIAKKELFYSPQFVTCIEQKIAENHNPPPSNWETLGDMFPTLRKDSGGIHRLPEWLSEILDSLKRQLPGAYWKYSIGLQTQMYFSPEFKTHLKAMIPSDKKKLLESENSALSPDVALSLDFDPRFATDNSITSYGSFVSAVSRTASLSKISPERAQRIFNLIMCIDEVVQNVVLKKGDTLEEKQRHKDEMIKETVTFLVSLCTFFKDDMENTEALAHAFFEKIKPLLPQLVLALDQKTKLSSYLPRSVKVLIARESKKTQSSSGNRY